MIKACLKNFSIIGTLFLKLQNFKVSHTPYESWPQLFGLFFQKFYLYIYPPESQESNRGANT